MRKSVILSILLMVLFASVLSALSCKPRAAPAPTDGPASAPNQATPSQVRDEHFESGNIALTAENYEQAILEFSQAIKLDPNYALAYNCRGIAYTFKKEHDKAIADLTKAMELGFNHASVYYFRGCEYTSAGEYDKAIADFTKSIELDPNYSWTYLMRATAYTQKGEYEKADTDLATAKKCDPIYVFK